MRSLACTLILAATPVVSQPVTVVTDIPVTHSLTDLVMGDIGTPALLLDPATDPHHVSLRPSQTQVLSEAGLFIWIGPELTPPIEGILSAHPPQMELRLLESGGATLAEYENDGDDGHGHGDHEDEEDGEEAHGHADHGDIDPHAWLDPANAANWLDAIATALAGADPENAQTYLANADSAKARLAPLVDEVRARLAPLEDRSIIVAHDAYGYFSRAFDVEISGTISDGDAAEPGARHLAELREDIAAHDVACVFGEPAHGSGHAEALANDVGIPFGTLDATGATLEPGPDLYEALILGLADNIAACASSES